MGGRFAVRWLMGFLMIAALAGVAFYAYNLGVAHGVVQGVAERAVAAAPGAATFPVVFYPRPWGFGFGFFPFLFILFGIFLLRGLFWRRAWYGGYACGSRGVPRGFDEWHRRAHGQDQPPATPVNL
jgi:hypothetical protein